ncbi:MAG: hypothetical protein R3C14_02880 [Caldilineaceae bacterium]
MASKPTKTPLEATKAAALTEAVSQHVEMVKDLDGMAARVARVALVQEGAAVVAVGVGRYALSRVDAATIGGLANKARTLVVYE